MTSIILLVNPNSGGQRGKKILDAIQNYLNTKNIPYVTHASSSLTHLRELTLTIAQQYTPQQKLVIVGGDGTIHHVVQTLVQHNYRIPVGCIPSGTGNDFAGSTVSSHDTLAQLDDILSCNDPFILPILKASDHIAVNSFGIGFDAQVCQLVEKSKIKPFFNRLKLGFLSYALLVIRALFQFKTFDLTVNGVTYPKVAMATFLNNNRFGGGIVLDPSLQIFDTQAHAIIIHSLSPMKIASLIYRLLKQQHLTHECVLQIPFTDNLHLSFDGMIPTQADGEVNELGQTPQTIHLIDFPFWLTKRD